MLDPKSTITQCSQLCNEARETAQKLLNHYVKVQGLTISQVGDFSLDKRLGHLVKRVDHTGASETCTTPPLLTFSSVLFHWLQMLRKSVETRDWLNTIEPRNVRAVMKRVVEDITAIDSQVSETNCASQGADLVRTGWIRESDPALTEQMCVLSHSATCPPRSHSVSCGQSERHFYAEVLFDGCHRMISIFRFQVARVERPNGVVFVVVVVEHCPDQDSINPLHTGVMVWRECWIDIPCHLRAAFL